MNIFILDEDPLVAAQFLFDKHVVKMALETAQILSTINGGPYKPTHMNHPCVKWTEAGFENYMWVWLHGLGICNEYKFRYGKEHKCEAVIRDLNIPLVPIPPGNTKPMLCMPDEFKTNNTVESYRNYYRSKSAIAAWTKRSKPEWF